MVNKVLETLSDYVGRRGFLGWAVKASVALAASILGVKTATAQSVSCCTLCESSSPVCDCVCTWCWTCCFNGTMWECRECFDNFEGCDSGCHTAPCKTSCCPGFDLCGALLLGCNEVICSKAICLGTSC
jgi:hypothetical protein